MKNIKILSLILAFLVMANCCSQSTAIELDMSEIGFPVEKLEMHGFFSQGYLKSSNNDVYVDSRDGTLDLREFGVNFSGYLNDRVFLATQIVGYNLGGQGGDEFSLHYALADVRLTDFLSVKAGRIRIPAGLYNETRDIDMIRKSVFLPQNIYSEYYRDYYSAHDGVTLHGGIDMSSLGFLSYQVGVGKPITVESVNGDFPYNFAANMVKDLSYRESHSANCQILYETPFDGLRFGYTWRRLDVEFLGNAYVPAFSAYFPAELDLKNYVTQVWSTEYQVDALTLMTEIFCRTSDGTKQNQGWYAGADYEFTDKFGAGMYYSEYVVTDESSEIAAADQKTVSLFGRYNITDSWLVKAQVDFNEGNGNAQFPCKVNANDDGDSVLFSLKTTWAF